MLCHYGHDTARLTSLANGSDLSTGPLVTTSACFMLLSAQVKHDGRNHCGYQ